MIRCNRRLPVSRCAGLAPGAKNGALITGSRQAPWSAPLGGRLGEPPVRWLPVRRWRMTGTSGPIPLATDEPDAVRAVVGPVIHMPTSIHAIQGLLAVHARLSWLRLDLPALPGSMSQPTSDRKSVV